LSAFSFLQFLAGVRALNFEFSKSKIFVKFHMFFKKLVKIHKKSTASEEKYLPLSEAAKHTPYSAEYLSLRARQGKLRAIKIGKIWVTKREWIEEYVRKYRGIETLKPKIEFAKPEIKFEILKTKFQTLKDTIFKTLNSLSFEIPKLKTEFLLALAFVLFFVSFVFAKDSLQFVAKGIVSAFNEFGQDLAIGAKSTISSLKSQLAKTGKNFKHVFSLAKEGAEELIENSGDALFQTSQKINFGVAAIGETTQRGLASVSEFFKEYFQWLGENFLTAGRKIKNFGLGVKEAVSGGIKEVGEKIPGIPELFKRKPEKIGAQKEVPEEITKKITTLEEKIKELENTLSLKKEIIVEKEVERKVVVEPIKRVEVEKITEFIPSEELAKIKSQLAIFGEITKKIQPTPPYTIAPTSPIYIQQGIQGGAGIFASLAAESAAFRTLGVGASATIGSAPQDKVSVYGTTEFFAPVTARAGLTVGTGTLNIDSFGNLQTTGTLTAATSTISDLTITGNLTVLGAQSYSGAAEFVVTSTSPALSVVQNGTGDIVLLKRGVEIVFQIDNSGNILGTKNLTIQGTSTLATTTLSRLTITELTPGSVLFAGPGGLVSQDNSNLFWDNTNKRLGIRTSNPAYALTVNGDLYVFATSTLGSATSTPVIFGGYVQSNIIPYFDNQYTLGLSNYRWANIFAATGTFGGTITIGTNTIQGSATTTLFTSGNANQLVLGANGNVGIGTATPSQKLDVQGGNINTSGSLMTGGVARIDSSGNLTNIGTISSTYLVTGASYVNLTGSASLQVGGVTVLTSGRALQNLTGIISSGTIQFTGLSANRLVATDGSSNLTTTISSANLAASVTDETGTGYLVFSNSPSISSPILSGTISGTYTIGGTPTLASSLTGSGSPNITGIGLLSATNLTISGTATTTNLNVTELTNLATTTISTQLSVPLITSPSTLTISPSGNVTTTITGL
jgi:hypothetical protein